MSMSGLLENIVRHHIELYADDLSIGKGCNAVMPTPLHSAAK